MGILRAITLALCLAIGAGAQAQDCRPDQAHLRGDFGTVSFTVELATTAQARARGLMNRDRMARFSGMLFIYERAQPLVFWMRNTLIPLDILFFDEGGRLTSIQADAIPLDETHLPGEGLNRYVLEINGGLTAQLGIAPGAELRHPLVAQDRALWPC